MGCCTSYYNIPSSLPEGAFRKFPTTKTPPKEILGGVCVFSAKVAQLISVVFYGTAFIGTENSFSESDKLSES